VDEDEDEDVEEEEAVVVVEEGEAGRGGAEEVPRLRLLPTVVWGGYRGLTR
jgi:hypothetical protein